MSQITFESCASSIFGTEIPFRPVAIFGFGMLWLGISVGSFGGYVSALIERGVNPSTAGFGTTLFILGQLLVVLPADWLTRRVPVRSVTVAGFLSAAVGMGFAGVFPIEVHNGALFLLGVGVGAIFIIAMKYSGLRVDGQSVAKMQGIIGGMFTLGIAVGIAVTPTAIDRMGLLAPTTIPSFFLVVAAISALTLTPVPTSQPISLLEYVNPFHSSTGIILGMTNAVSFGFLIVAITWYTDIFTIIAVPVTLSLFGFAVATFIGRTGSGWTTMITGERHAVYFGLVFLTIALGVSLFGLYTDTQFVTATGLILTGLGFGLPFGPLFSLAFANLGSDAGALLVGMIAIGNAVAVIFPWLIGWLLEQTGGYSIGLGIMLLTVAITAILWDRIIR